MSYQWSQKYTTSKRFPKKLYKLYGNLPHIAGYKDPLYAFATLNVKGSMTIEGVKSEWMSPSPYDLGMPKDNNGDANSPQISDFRLSFRL